MTTKQTAPPAFRPQEKYAPEDQFPERPKRTDMQNAVTESVRATEPPWPGTTARRKPPWSLEIFQCATPSGVA